MTLKRTFHAQSIASIWWGFHSIHIKSGKRLTLLYNDDNTRVHRLRGASLWWGLLWSQPAVPPWEGWRKDVREESLGIFLLICSDIVAKNQDSEIKTSNNLVKKTWLEDLDD